MPFAVATVALITAELLTLPSAVPAHSDAAAPAALRREQRPVVASPPAPTPGQDPAGYRLKAATGPEGSTDLAVYLGRRDHGAQFELGALGGGRSDAPGLLHVGVGWDF